MADRLRDVQNRQSNLLPRTVEQCIGGIGTNEQEICTTRLQSCCGVGDLLLRGIPTACARILNEFLEVQGAVQELQPTHALAMSISHSKGVQRLEVDAVRMRRQTDQARYQPLRFIPERHRNE